MRFLLTLLLLLGSFPALAQDFNMSDFRKTPVLNEGRVKPLDSFARSYLVVMSGKSKAGSLTAIEWLAETLFTPEIAHERPFFLIADPRLRDALELPELSKNRYSFSVLTTSFRNHQTLLDETLSKPDTSLTDFERALVNLYFKTLAYAEISHSLSLVLPGEDGKPYLETGKFSAGQTSHQSTRILRIIPPLWESDGDVWISPWQVFADGRGSPQSAAFLTEWQKLADAYRAGNIDEWAQQAKTTKDAAYNLAGVHADKDIMTLEVIYNNLGLINISLYAYIACFILLLAGFISGKETLIKISFITLSVTALFHLTAIVMRVIIMARPPVSTLYETTIFVSLIAVILCLLFEWRRKDGMALITAALIGSVLLFISTRYAADGDTMQMLVAVLDTNFWLATHVVTITIGYGATLVAGCLAHIYLIRGALGHGGNAALLKTVQATGLVALLFAILGTILGGIWADQSWGRFWGWDPKENGAMLVCLWLLFCFHGKLAGQLSPPAFAALMSLGNITVALAWFGVNLLSVGLHSYGFTQGIALALGGFCGAELVFVIGAFILMKRKMAK